jgi:hypothetical protein
MAGGLNIPEAALPVEWDREADVVVIGAGATGLPAAIVAREAGASVIVVEAEADIGGHAITSGGNVPLGGGTSVQRQYGIEDSPDLLFRDLTDWSVVGPNGFPDYRYNDREIIRAFADNSAPAFEWLLAHGVVFVDKAPDAFGGNSVGGIAAGIEGDARGAKPDRQVTVLFRESWQDACRELDVTLPWTTRRANLLVSGVAPPQQSGGQIRIGDVVLEVTLETDDRLHTGSFRIEARLRDLLADVDVGVARTDTALKLIFEVDELQSQLRDIRLALLVHRQQAHQRRGLLTCDGDFIAVADQHVDLAYRKS